MRMVMEYNKKKITRVIKFIINAAFLALAIFITQITVFTPIFELLDYRVTNMAKAMDPYWLATNGDQKATERLEQLSYRDSGVAYIFLIKIYRGKALDAAGVDVYAPNVSFDSVDLSKSNALILRSIQALSDYELLTVLHVSEALYNDKERDRIIAQVEKMNTGDALRSEARFIAYSTFDQATKDQLMACKSKLDEEFSTTLGFIMKFRSFGACTETPPSGSMIKAFNRSVFNPL